MGKPNFRRKLPSIVRWILWVALVQFILFNTSAAFYAYKFTHFYNDPTVQQSQPEGNVFTKTWKLFSGPKFSKSIAVDTPSFPIDTVILKTESGIIIDSWYGKTVLESKGTVILFHALTINKGKVLAEATAFRHLGYNVFMIDFRAHGNSGGNTTTIGVKESEEVKLAFDYLNNKGEKNIFLWGSSMGAVAITKAIADYDLHPAAVILEMPFASLQYHLKARARMFGFSGFPEKPFSFFVAGWMGIERGFNGFNHKTSSYVEKMKSPVLLQWGGLDGYVKKEETDKIFKSIATADKKLVIYPTAAHESLLQRDPMKWEIEVEKFLTDHRSQ